MEILLACASLCFLPHVPSAAARGDTLYILRANSMTSGNFPLINPYYRF